MRYWLLVVLLIPASVSAANFQSIVQYYNAAASAVSAFFEDDFNRSDSASVGGSWDTEQDGATNTVEISSNKMLVTHGTSEVAYVGEDFGSDVTECWAEFDISFNEVSDTATTTYSMQKFVTFFDTGESAQTYAIYAQVNGDTARLLYRFGISYNTIATNQAGTTGSYSASTEYNVKFHVREGGAGDLLYLAIDDTPVINDTYTINSGEVCGAVRVGASSTGFIGWTDLAYTIDNFKYYTSNPGW